MDSIGPAIIGIIFGIGILVLILWALRPVFLWYHGVKELISKQDRIISLLGRILNEIVDAQDKIKIEKKDNQQG